MLDATLLSVAESPLAVEAATWLFSVPPMSVSIPARAGKRHEVNSTSLCGPRAHQASASVRASTTSAPGMGATPKDTTFLTRHDA